QLGLLLRGRRPRRRGNAQHGDPSTRGEVEMSGPNGHLLQLDHVSKYFGNVIALKDVSLHVNAGEVTCLLGDNGAGKSTLIKILSGVHQHDEGRVLVEGSETTFASPRDARHAGIATVYQDLAMVPL